MSQVQRGRVASRLHSVGGFRCAERSCISTLAYAALVSASVVLTSCGVPAASAKPAVKVADSSIAPSSSRRHLSPGAAVRPPLRVAIWGDSLVAQSVDYVRFFFDLSGRVRVGVFAVGGTALCDWLTDMRSETDPANRSGFHPQVAVVALSGGALTPCMSTTAQLGTEAALMSRYALDAARAIEIFRQRRIPVYFVAAPLWRRDADLGRVGMTPIGWTYSMLPTRYPGEHLVRFIDAGAALEWQGHYTDALPCQRWEKCTGRWADGTPTVVVRQADGGHFCPVLPAQLPGEDGAVECPVYMGGAARYAQAIATPVLRDFGLS